MELVQNLPSDSELLEQINMQLGRLGQTSRYKRLPEVPAACAALHRCMLVMVDDSPDVLAAYVPHLVVATRGSAALVLHQEQDIAQLVEETLVHSPDTILMDYFLAGDLRGDAVVQFLRGRSDRAVACIGFSSMASAARRHKIALGSCSVPRRGCEACEASRVWEGEIKSPILSS